MIKPLWGITNLLASTKGVMCILILIAATVATLLGKVDGMGYSATMSVLGVIFCYTAHKTDIAQIQYGNKQP